MVLGLARPEVHDLFPDLWREHHVEEIRLSKLTRRGSERLARAVLGDGAPQAVVDRITERAAGNALYLEELIRAAADTAKADLLAAGFASVDYVEARRADTLAPFGAETCPAGTSGRLLIAARLGKTRLIDNIGFVRR